MEPSRRRATEPPVSPVRGRARRSAPALVLAAVLAVLTACTGGDPESSAGSPSSSDATPATTAAAVGRWPDLPQSGLPADVADRLEAEMTSWVDRELLPGVTAAVASPQGVWVGAAGVDGAGTALAPDSAMSLFFITQAFTAAEVMLLAEQGEIDLDAPASTYVALPQVANGATVRHLLSQRSAVSDPGWDDYFEELLAAPDDHRSSETFLASGPEATDPPGESFTADITNYETLGLVIEEVTGEDLADVLRRDLWTPLGLPRLVLQDEQKPSPPVALPGDDDELPEGIEDASYVPFRSVVSAIPASTGAAGDAESVARWGYLLYGAHLLTPESVAQMTDFADDDYGLGAFDCSTRILESPSIDCVGHEGEFMGYSVALVVVPSARTSVVVLSPSTNKAYGFVKWLVSAGNLLGNAPTT